MDPALPITIVLSPPGARNRKKIRGRGHFSASGARVVRTLRCGSTGCRRRPRRPASAPGRPRWTWRAVRRRRRAPLRPRRRSAWPVGCRPRSSPARRRAASTSPRLPWSKATNGTLTKTDRRPSVAVSLTREQADIEQHGQRPLLRDQAVFDPPGPTPVAVHRLHYGHHVALRKRPSSASTARFERRVRTLGFRSCLVRTGNPAVRARSPRESYAFRNARRMNVNAKTGVGTKSRVGRIFIVLNAYDFRVPGRRDVLHTNGR